MELQKGICFLCHNKKVVGASEAESALQIICSLFPKEVLNVTELKSIQSSLKFCPICYHKLIILKCCGENIETNKENEDASDKCVLCKSGKVLFKIKNWPLFNNISENLVPKDEDTYIACSECLFYLDTRNVIKSKLISKYPQLKAKSANSNGNKRKSRNTSDGVSHSTPISRNKRKREAKDVVIISSGSEDDSAKRESYNYDSLKKLQPLKLNRIFRRQEIVKSDSKFLSQIPYVLLKSFNVSSENNNKNVRNKPNDKGVSDKMVHKEKTDLNISKNKPVSPELNTIQSTPMKKTKRIRIYPKSIKLKKDIREQKRSTAKDLVINLTKINVLQKHKTKARNYKHDPEIEKLIDKFNVLQRPTTESSRNVDEESSNDSSKETNGVKTKRKSVSFADEKNVEIEFYQNDSKINSISEAKNRKRNYQSDIPENDAQTETQNIKSKEENDDDEDVINSAQITKSGKADENVHENSSSEEDKDDKNVVSDEERATNDNEDADSHAHAKTKLKIKFKPVKPPDETTQEHEKGEEESEVDTTERKKVKAKRDRPKPLSKKKRRDSVLNMENIAEDDGEKSNKSMNSEDDKESSSSKSPSNKDAAGDSESSGTEETTQKPEKSEEETEVDKIEIENQPKREKPKPLSKKKGNSRKNSDNATGDDAERPTNSENEETSSSKKAEAGVSGSSDGEETTEKRDEREVEVKSKPKRERPKPLSKKKRRDSSKNLEDTAEDSANISGENTISENDKETSTSKSKDDLDTGTVSDDETANKDDSDNVPSSEQKEKEIELDTETKVTETDVDSESNLAAGDEPEDEINKSKESAEDSSLSKIDDGDNTSGNTSLESEEAEGNSKKTSPDEDNENEPTSGRKLNEEDDSMNGDEEHKTTPEESTQLNDSKDIDSEENVNSEIGNDKLNEESKEVGEDAKTEDGKKVEPFDSNSFSGSDKNDELGISEDDTNNINSILTGMFTPEEQSGDNAVNEWKVIEKDADDKTNHKRKTSVDELNTSPDKKKKKVTFCEDFT